jgi:phosphinothricin acetyltransferase
MIRPVKPEDAQAICEIYNYYVDNTVISFEEQPITAAEMKGRIKEITRKHPWIVEEEEGRILGYAYAYKYRERLAYRHTVEITVYLKDSETGKGLGTRLMKRLIEETRERGYHTLISAIAIPNERSVSLHEKCGFKKAGHLHETGFKFNQWIDVGYWELVLVK